MWLDSLDPGPAPEHLDWLAPSATPVIGLVPARAQLVDSLTIPAE